MFDLPPSPPLTMEEMWQAWPGPKDAINEISQEEFEQHLSELSTEIIEDAPMGERKSLDPTSPRVLAVQKHLRATKLSIYADIIKFYHQESDKRQFLKRWEELHAPAVVATGLAMRLKRATEGKDAANFKYSKEDNWFGAMYTYALSWGCFLPFYPEALAASEPLRIEIGKFEGAVWSNIAACCTTGSSRDNVEDVHRQGIIQLGLRSALVCMAMSEYVTVGVIQKACNRAVTLREMLKPESHQTTDGEAAVWKRQAEALNGVDPKMLFSEIKSEKKMMEPRYANLVTVQPGPDMA